MVRLRAAGGGLIADLERLQEAARRHSTGDAVSAVAIYRAILKQTPQQPDALHMLGVIAMQAGNAALALSMTEAALAAQPDFAAAWVNRALILHEQGRHMDAMQSARCAIEADVGLGEAWDALGLILHHIGEDGEAATCHARAVLLQPDNAHFHGNYAAFLLAQGDLGAAYREALCAENLDASWPPMILGNCVKAMGYPEKAVTCFARARALGHALMEATTSEAMAHLLMGDWTQGWGLWEQRPDLAPDLKTLPFWQGQKIDHLLLYEDQGLGDAVHFARYIPWLRGHVRHLTVRISAALKPLFIENFYGITIIDEDENPAKAMYAFDARCRLASLPFFAGTMPINTSTGPYLDASEPKRIMWRERLRDLSAPRIGIVWAGNANFRGDKTRSLDVDILRPIIQEWGTEHIVSLQKDRVQKDVVADTGIYDAAPDLNDFSDTAALMAELDLIVTVDTATAHLAGALGKPVFVLLPFDNDWRWLIGREDSPWYPTARLFRQTKPGDWDSALVPLADAVQTFIAGDRGMLQPRKWGGEALRQNPYALSLKA